MQGVRVCAPWCECCVNCAVRNFRNFRQFSTIFSKRVLCCASNTQRRRRREKEDVALELPFTPQCIICSACYTWFLCFGVWNIEREFWCCCMPRPVGLFINNFIVCFFVSLSFPFFFCFNTIVSSVISIFMIAAQMYGHRFFAQTGIFLYFYSIIKLN